MKLHEEFKLYENMWDTNEALAEDIKNGVCDACKEKQAGMLTAYGEHLCAECDDKYCSTEKGKLELLLGIILGGNNASGYTPQEVYNAVLSWCNHRDELPFALQKRFITKPTGLTEARHFMTDNEYKLKKALAKKLKDCGNNLAAEIVWKFDVNISDKISEVAMDRDTGTCVIPRELVKKGTPWSKLLDGVTKAIDVAKNASSNAVTESLTESRSIADIEAEIARLQQELQQAKIAEKKASYGGNFPKTVWTWDIYLEPSEKGTWTGIENDLVFETKDKALDAAWELLNELNDEGELDGDPDDYYVEAFEIPLSSVSKEVLKYSNLTHLI